MNGGAPAYIAITTARCGFIGYLTYMRNFSSNTLFTKKQLTCRSELNIILRYDGIDFRLRASGTA